MATRSTSSSPSSRRSRLKVSRKVPTEFQGGRLQAARLRSKKDRIIELYKETRGNLMEIATHVGCRPSYVASVLQREGLLESYFDLYTTTSREQNVYSPYFKNVLSFKTPEAAEESVARLNELFEHFERLGDRAGQHHAMMLALTGMNRARWGGKLEEADRFRDWLLKASDFNRDVPHLQTQNH